MALTLGLLHARYKKEAITTRTPKGCIDMLNVGYSLFTWQTFYHKSISKVNKKDKNGKKEGKKHPRGSWVFKDTSCFLRLGLGNRNPNQMTIGCVVGQHARMGCVTYQRVNCRDNRCFNCTDRDITRSIGDQCLVST